MKELSIEQKAKRYDEAIEKFDVILNLNTVKESGTIFAYDVRKILPELKESGGEKIRKWLIGYFNQYIIDGMPQVFGNGLNVKDVIAWLEKQGEQNLLDNVAKQVTKDKETATSFLRSTGIINENGELAELYRVCESISNWSEEDERMYKKIETAIDSYYAPFSRDAEEMSEWLKSLKERIQSQNK